MKNSKYKDLVYRDGKVSSKYIIYSNGSIFNKDTGKFLIGGAYGNTKQLLYYLNRSGRRISTPISVLLAKAFIENPNKYKYVRFKDGNEENISLENLEWTDTRINNIRNGKVARGLLGAKISRKDILNIRNGTKSLKDNIDIQHYRNKVAKKYDISKDNVSDIIYGRCYKWVGGPIICPKKRKNVPDEIVIKIRKAFNKRIMSYKKFIEVWAEKTGYTENTIKSIVDGRTHSHLKI